MSAYQAASRRAVATLRAAYEDSQPDGTVVVVGEPSSGTRLLTRLVRAAGVQAIHDNRHGRRPWSSGRVVIATRDPQARAESVAARWPQWAAEAPFPPLEQLHVDYPNAAEVAYEDVVADKDAVIARLADLLGVEPWEFTEDVYDANSERGSRDARP